MKVAILTLPLHANYGGILQAYALQTTLQRLGHDVEVLQKKSKYPWPTWKMNLIFIKRFFNKHIFHKSLEVFLEKRKNKEKVIAEQNTSYFIDQYINI
ncbi:MAG: polysaccharide pyruvyl transferase family protein, partial [Bacteroides sp.]|nr:polysaccharide pyruvyl transferase family protein [Bacteroides sp.]